MRRLAAYLGPVVPAQAGTQEVSAHHHLLDSRLRGNDGLVDSRLRGNDGLVDSRLRGNDAEASRCGVTP